MESPRWPEESQEWAYMSFRNSWHIPAECFYFVCCGVQCSGAPAPLKNEKPDWYTASNITAWTMFTDTFWSTKKCIALQNGCQLQFFLLDFDAWAFPNVQPISFADGLSLCSFLSLVTVVVPEAIIPQHQKKVTEPFSIPANKFAVCFSFLQEQWQN